VKLQVYSIRDAKGEVYNTPFFQKTHGEAERNFRELVSDPKSMVSKYPEDFDLYHLGTYDDQSGLIKPLDTPLHILKAISVQPKPSSGQIQILDKQA
jgi:hypothetical protein